MRISSFPLWLPLWSLLVSITSDGGVGLGYGDQDGNISAAVREAARKTRKATISAILAGDERRLQQLFQKHLRSQAAADIRQMSLGFRKYLSGLRFSVFHEYHTKTKGIGSFHMTVPSQTKDHFVVQFDASKCRESYVSL